MPPTNRIYPDWHEIDAFPTPLTAGERALARFLDDKLPQGYRIYVQPWINSLAHPDIVIVHNDWGAVVFEVKDWSVESYSRTGGKLFARNASGPSAEPAEQAKRYARVLFQNFLSKDEPARHVGEESNDWRIVPWRVYFHGATESAARRLFPDLKEQLLVGENLSIENAVPWAKYTTMPGSKFLSDEQSKMLEGLHRFLQPIANQALSDRPRLGREQLSLAEPSRGHFRIRGVAGSGKSWVLAERAARASRNGPVLATCFNITMAHILQDWILESGARKENVTVRHYHGLIKDLCTECGLTFPQPITAVSGRFAGRYRGVYIDEGQDFEHEWIDDLCTLLQPETGELVLMADHRQGIYVGRSGADGRKLRVAKFEPWRHLKSSHRLKGRRALSSELDRKASAVRRPRGSRDRERDARTSTAEPFGASALGECSRPGCGAGWSKKHRRLD